MMPLKGTRQQLAFFPELRSKSGANAMLKSSTARRANAALTAVRSIANYVVPGSDLTIGALLAAIKWLHQRHMAKKHKSIDMLVHRVNALYNRILEMQWEGQYVSFTWATEFHDLLTRIRAFIVRCEAKSGLMRFIRSRTERKEVSDFTFKIKRLSEAVAFHPLLSPRFSWIQRVQRWLHSPQFSWTRCLQRWFQ